MKSLIPDGHTNDDYLECELRKTEGETGLTQNPEAGCQISMVSISFIKKPIRSPEI